MFVDARQLADGALIEGDVCIIGGGAAGITLARDLAGGGRRIFLLESGGLEFEQATQNLYEGETTGPIMTPLVADRVRQLGGSTNHWSGYCRPFDPIDFEVRDDMPWSGWPFGREELDPYYRRAQPICQLGPFAYEPADWKVEGVEPFDFGGNARLRSGVAQVSPPTRFGEVYRADLASASGVSVHLHANVTAIETDERGQRVTGLRVACLDGPKFRAQARVYVLACGGVENARLLLNAQTERKPAPGNAAGLVGRYFMDHAWYPHAAQIVFAQPQRALAFFENRTVRGTEVAGYLYGDAVTLRKEKLPGFSILLQPESLPDGELFKASLHRVWRSITAFSVPDHLWYYLGRIGAGVERRLESGWDRLVHRTPSYYNSSYICEVPPDPDSRVTLIDAVDALGLRRVKLDWRLPKDLTENMRRAHRLLAQDLGGAGLGRVQINAAADEDTEIANAHHHMGTTRMHADPKQGVVDADCRVHGTENLFIAGSSVFPTYSFDDPTLTIVTLALRLSDYLKKSEIGKA